MKIAIDNLGPIKHADIDLSKDLIILCGGNNSGKTYVAYSVYGLFKFKEIALNMLTGFVEPYPLLSHLCDRPINLDLTAFYHDKKNEILSYVQDRYIEYLPTVFASNESFFQQTICKIILNDEEIAKKINDRTIVENFDSFGVTWQFKKESNTSLLNISISYKSIDDIDLILVDSELMKIIFDIIFNQVYIETAERTAINLFNKEIAAKRTKMVDALLDYDEERGVLAFVKQNASRYSLPIRDNLQIANRMDILQKQQSSFAYLADEIEKSILQGKISVAKTGELQFSPAKSKKSLGIHLTASGVKSLSSIIFYLRHIAQKGDLFIIDEPELNLHPDNQRKVARVIAQMVDAGIKVMLSTHSDYIIRELNNLIMLDVKGNDKVVNKLIKKYGYKQDQILNPEKVGVYLFTDKVEALEVNATGFEVKSIDDEINALNESAQDIFFTLHDN